MIQRQTNRARSPSKGQALVEYAMLMLVIIGVFFVINRQVRRGVGKLWLTLGKEITAGCVGCTPPENVR